MIKIKPVLVNIVVLYSLMLGMMVLNYLDAIDSGAHLSAVSIFLIWMSAGTLCVICTCHTYKIDEKGVRQLWLFIPKFTPWSAFTEVSIESLFPDQPSDTRDRYVICLNRGVSRINQSSSAGTHLMRFLVFELLDGPPTKRQDWRVFRYPYIQRDEILQLLETVGVTVIERDYN